MTEQNRLEYLLEEHHLSGTFTLSTGRIVSKYFDITSMLLDPEGLRLSYVALKHRVRGVDYGNIACGEMTPIPLVAKFVSDGFSGIVVRKRSKGYGTNRLLEKSTYISSKSTLVVEDVVATGRSIRYVIDTLETNGFIVAAIVALVNLHGGCDDLLRYYDFRWVYSSKEILVSGI